MTPTCTRRLVARICVEAATGVLGRVASSARRLLVVGSGRECLIPAVADRHVGPALARRHRTQGTLKSWTATLVMATFLLTILGTFMTRSGVFNSVHSLTQSSIGPATLSFLAIALIWTIGLLAARIDRLESSRDVGPAASRGGAFLRQQSPLRAVHANGPGRHDVPCRGRSSDGPTDCGGPSVLRCDGRAGWPRVAAPARRGTRASMGQDHHFRTPGQAGAAARRRGARRPCRVDTPGQKAPTHRTESPGSSPKRVLVARGESDAVLASQADEDFEWPSTTWSGNTSSAH